MDFQPLFNIFTSKPVIRQREENIQAMMEEIDKACVFPQDVLANRGLVSVFTQTKASRELSFDLLNFREIGSNDLENFINHYFLKQPSTTAPVRKNRLLTIALTKKVNKRYGGRKMAGTHGHFICICLILVHIFFKSIRKMSNALKKLITIAHW